MAWFVIEYAQVEVYVHDLGTGAELRFTNARSVQPALASGLMAYATWDPDAPVPYNPDNNGVTVVNLASGAVEHELVGFTPYELALSDEALYMAVGANPIQSYDLNTGVVSPLPVYGGGDIDVSGDYLVTEMDHDWDGTVEIFLCDLSSQETTQISQDLAGGFRRGPAISGDRVVWGDPRDGNWDIFMVEISTAVIPSIEAIKEQIDLFVADGSITNYGTGESLKAFLDQAAADIDAGDIESACTRLAHFIDRVHAKSGKQISVEAAQVLVEMAELVCTDLGCT